MWELRRSRLAMKLTGISSMGISSQRYFTLIGPLHLLLDTL